MSKTLKGRIITDENGVKTYPKQGKEEKTVKNLLIDLLNTIKIEF